MVVWDGTKDDTIQYSNQKNNLIKELINEGNLNMQEISSQVHFLTVNEKWDKMQEELLKSQIEKTLKLFPDVLENQTIMIKGKPSSKGSHSYSASITLEKRKRKKVKSN